MTNLVNNPTQYAVSNGGIDSGVIYENSTAQTMFMGITPDVLIKTATATPPLIFADKFINSKMGGEENKSWLKKIADFGDRIAEKFKFDGKFIQKVDETIDNNRFTKYFTDEFAANPRNMFAKMDFMKNEKYAKELAEHLASLKDKNEFQNIKSKLKPETTKYIEEITEYVTNSKDKKIDIELNKIRKEIPKLIDATDDLMKNGLVKIKGSFIFETDLSELRNQAKTANSQMGKTMFGNMLAKGALNLKKYLTMGGDALGMIFIPFSFFEALHSASKADEDEKTSTFMHVFGKDYSGMFLFAPAINFLYNIGGNKYRGISKEARAEIENIIKSINTNEFASKDAVEIAKIKIDLLIQGVKPSDVKTIDGKSVKEAKKLAENLKKTGKLDLKFWERPLRFFGRVLSMGLDEIQPPKYFKGKFPIVGRLKKPRPTLKGQIGGLGRLALIMGVMQPLFQEPVMFVVHKIFGTPTKYLKKEEKMYDDYIHGTENQETLVPPEKTNVDKTNDTETNLIKKWSKGDISQMPSKAINNKPITPFVNNATENAQPIKQNKEIASAKLERQKNEDNLYVPSIQVDFSNLQNNQEVLEQRVYDLLKDSDDIIDRANNALNH